MVPGLVMLHETVEQAILNHIRTDVGEEQSLVDRLVQDPDHIELEKGQVLLSLTSNDRVHFVSNAHGLQSLRDVTSETHKVGYYPIDVRSLIAIHPAIARALGKVE